MKRRNFLTLAISGLTALLGFALGTRMPHTRQPNLTTEGQPSPAPTATNSKVHKWKMVTSWPAGAPGTGTTAERLAQRIQLLSQQRIQITTYSAGELVGGLEVFDAVSRGIAEMGHTASFFWQGKTPLAAFFTAVPFGLNPDQHHSWLYQGGGQGLWDEIYRPFGLKPFTAGNTGPSMGGWFKRPLDFAASQPLKGVKFRMPGLGGAVIQQLGALPVAIPPGEIFAALQSGVIDAAELLAPWNDRAFGLHKIAKYCYYPGFHEPNGSAECLINLATYESLPAELQQVIEEACRAENIVGLAESDWYNAEAMEQLRNEGVSFIAYPQPLLNQMREIATQVVKQATDISDLGRRLHKSYRKAQDISLSWGSTKL